MSERVVITGMGIVCALGRTADEVANNARAARRSFAPVRAFDATGFKVNLAAEAPALDFGGRFGRRTLAHTSRTDQLALWAVADALAQADLPPEALRNAGLYVGASSGGLLEMEPHFQTARDAPPVRFWTYPIWETAACVTRHFGVGGPRASLMTACSSSAHALGLAMRRVRSGELELAIAGGSESMCRLTLSGFGSLGVLDPNGTRPFDAGRQGITLGEGAAFFVLEPWSRAHRRGARPLGILAGYGAAAEAHHMVHPREDGSGATGTIRAALADAGVPVDAIDYVNAHGTGTIQNDAMEARAVAKLVGERTGVRISSSKSMIGHTLGAAGALEAGITLLGMTRGFVPPNPGVTTPAPELGELELVTTADGSPPRVAVSTSFAFGGNNAALVLAGTDTDLPSIRPDAPRRTVVVTGAAAVCSRGLASTPEALADLPSRPAVGRGLEGLDAGAVLGRPAIRRMDALSAAATSVCALASRAAGLTAFEPVGLSFGTAFGSLDMTAAFIERLMVKGAHLVNPADFPNLVHNAPAGHAAILLGTRGPSITTCQEELAGDEALRAAWDPIESGELETAIAGGGDLQSAWVDLGYEKLDRLTRTRSAQASTLGALVLEAESAALGRGRVPWARILAIGSGGPWAGVQGAVGRALERLAANGVATPRLDLWCLGATERLGESHERRAAALPCLHDVPTLTARALLGGGLGGGPAVVAVAAGLIAIGRVRHVLVTSVTRDGAAQATLLGPAT